MRVKLILDLPSSTPLAEVYTAAHGLGCILRQLPDGTLIGEPIDPPTAAERRDNVIRFPRRRQRRANPRPGPQLIA